MAPGRNPERFEVFLVHAETVMRTAARVAVAAGSALPVEAATECRRLAHQLRRGALPTIATSPQEQAELAGIRVEAQLLAASDRSLMRTPRPSRRAGVRALRLSTPGVVLAGRTTLAAAVAGLLAAAVRLGYSYWASVSTVAILAAMNLSGATHRAVQRGIGTAVGVLIGLAALVLNTGPVAAVVMVIVCSGLAELTVARNYALGVLFATRSRCCWRRWHSRYPRST